MKRLKSRFQKELTEAGCDEAGRGCLAGPVFAAAVILPARFDLKGLNDSKQISAQKREKLSIEIREQALAWAVASVSVEEIDKINILNASILAMHKAIDQLCIKPEMLLVDGNRFRPYSGSRHQCIIDGDAKFASIAAASILAKTERDHYMMQLDTEFPHYAWQKNKGYGTSLHREAIKIHGASIHHRKSFRLLPDPELFTLNTEV